jgi:L-asparaginase
MKELPKVDILYSYAQPNTDLIRVLVASGVKRIVFAGAGAGGLSVFERSALKTLWSSPTVSKPVVVRSSRVGNGRVIAETGLRAEYDALGIIPGDNLNPQKARVLLMLALTKTNDPEEIRRIFAEY